MSFLLRRLNTNMISAMPEIIRKMVI